jgi:deoxyhypusine synthase
MPSDVMPKKHPKLTPPEREELALAEKNLLCRSHEPEDMAEVRGYDFSKGLDWEKLIDAYATTGYQASHLAEAIEVVRVREMRREKCTVYLGYTSNLVTSGLRDILRFLVQKKHVHALFSTAGGVEEDFIKCMAPFFLGKFGAAGDELRDRGINRTGNIFVPNSRYAALADFVGPILDHVTNIQVRHGRAYTPSELIRHLGKNIRHPDSIYHWAYRNRIPVFSPAITDGALGDLIYLHRFRRPEFALDVAGDITRLNHFTFNARRAGKTGAIILGSGVVKHHILNANLAFGGLDYAVYINTAHEFDGSDAGARPDEAVSWGKIAPTARSVKVSGDATLLFPLLVAKAFMRPA